MTVDKNYDLGCRLPAEDWLWLNGRGIFDDPLLLPYVAPFPPKELMTNVSGLTNDRDFAAHGVEIFRALMQASPKPVTDYRNILDFGCGCGRLARMFKGNPNRIVGCDIDKRHVNWVAGNLDYMTACLISVNPPLPFGDDEFDAIISISVFTHLTEKSQDDFLAELSRIASRDGYLFLTVHGGQARSLNDILSVIRVVTGLQPVVQHTPCRRLDVPVNCLDFQLAKKELGWQPEISWEEGIARTWEWLKNSKQGD
jgi:SAM-dependent methyltransferase